LKIANLVFWIILGIVAVYSIVALTSTADSVTSIFGNTAFTVKTDSMAPTFEKGDLIYVDTDFDIGDIEVGDVITYNTLIDVDGDGEAELVLNSHRVVGIEEDVNEYIHFVTQGDNNSEQDLETVHQNHVVAIWNGKTTANLGGIIDGIVGFLKSGTGFFIFIVLPCFAFLIYEVYKFINVMTEYKTHQALDSRVKLQEEAIAMAKKQLEEEARLKALEEKK
jgi:signal peptidase I